MLPPFTGEKKMPNDSGPCPICSKPGTIGIVRSVKPYVVKWYCKKHDPYPRKGHDY